MFALNMFIITIMTTAQGLQPTCSHYCEHVSTKSRTVRLECNCTATDLQDASITQGVIITSARAKNTQLIYQPPDVNTAQVSQLHEQPFHQTNPVTKIPKTKEHKRVVRSDKSAENGTNNYHSGLQRFLKHNSNNDFNNKSKNSLELPIYLDIDLSTPVNDDSSDLKEELTHVFQKVRASEKDLSECINLHIYIFSKNNDNINKTHTNWGHHNNDKLSGSEVLTEIQNKCDQPTTIIHESVYKIRQRDSNGFNYPDDSNESTESNAYDEDEHTGKSDDLSTEDRSRNTDENKVVLKTTNASVDREIVNRNGVESLATITNHHSSGRSILPEKNILIPKIITTEFSNNTVSSVVDGYEILPNSDFIHHDFNAADEGDNISEEYREFESGRHGQSDLEQDVKGNLYFSFGTRNHIPARFIQNSEGEMHLAIDGFALCDQIRPEENKIEFVNILCNCIQMYNTSRSQL
ncbi:uncharacterized protein LOC142986703 [Anticarsia gemmatalis]|uniref:uncharacterized protein LOC142986703 n=1 Tax=Anticarsia gemmatalis TaxID=129554 RepID=UPI003F777BAC